MEIVVHLYENNFGITFMAWSFTFKIFSSYNEQYRRNSNVSRLIVNGTGKKVTI